jgi:hypothetical protein
MSNLKPYSLSSSLALLGIICYISIFSTISAQEKIKMDDFLESATIEGLMKENFPQTLARNILRADNDFFVGKCPICTPVRRAFGEYSRQENIYPKSKTPRKILKALNSTDREKQLLAFKALTTRYTQAYLKKLDLNASQTQALLADLEEGKKTGMGRKSDSFGDFCPSCEGACAMPK